MNLSFLGATGTVTGSKYLLQAGERRLLIDCGLFQGLKALRLRNWTPLPLSPDKIDAVLMTHAHIDHSGYLPLLARSGFAGPVYATSGTIDLCGILLPDAGHLQEEAARYANKYNFSKHKPALPLYTEADAIESLRRFKPCPFHEPFAIAGAFKASLLPAGHLLGAAIAAVEADDVRVVFSGDLGRSNDAVMRPPALVYEADYLVVESTYGNRLHDKLDPEIQLADCINRAAHRGGVVIIPAFAVGRAQTLLYYLSRLRQRNAIPAIPIYLNSPMAVDATRLYQRHHSEHRLNLEQCKAAFSVAKIINTPEESRALNERHGPMVIISASGMATGGRVLHHLKAFAPDARNMIVLAGFQAAGTRGASIADGAPSIKIHGGYVPVGAEVVKIDSLSAHADYSEILAWLKNFKRPPRHTFVTHGEPAAADEMRRRIEERPWAGR